MAAVASAAPASAPSPIPSPRISRLPVKPRSGLNAQSLSPSRSRKYDMQNFGARPSAAPARGLDRCGRSSAAEFVPERHAETSTVSPELPAIQSPLQGATPTGLSTQSRLCELESKAVRGNEPQQAGPRGAM